jgi:hypothetical protein
MAELPFWGYFGVDDGRLLNGLQVLPDALLESSIPHRRFRLANQ